MHAEGREAAVERKGLQQCHHPLLGNIPFHLWVQDGLVYCVGNVLVVHIQYRIAVQHLAQLMRVHEGREANHLWHQRLQQSFIAEAKDGERPQGIRDVLRSVLIQNLHHLS
eukprot:CAMPEP_0177783318 /NCGR_PEP_ID=MMETSP0491_2-20121128/19031_1 /TAXON_ID=63592 /ORGANISM="Tetraselmis chuii, Strain PLY429" /LENGTH=110 /DNA_ID=CAMNT_0019303865 /DNA_START=175 /DNA_END=507 /DNA_ORIENTATION=+